MPELTAANNTLYFKAFNEDYKAGGKYHNLDSSSLRTMVILQSYADKYGYVGNISGDGYSKKMLTQMLGVNYRTVLKALMALEKGGHIIVDEYGVIFITGFVSEQVYREQGSKKSTRGRANLAKEVNEIKTTLSTTTIYDKQTGEAKN